MKLKLLYLFFFLNFSTVIYCQETIGLLHHDISSYDGYTLFSPEKNNTVYLINNCGNVINTWTFSENPGLTCYLLENGNLLRAGQQSLEIRDWNSNLIWQYNLDNLELNQHHDIEPLPNGNILCLVKEIITEADQILLGKDPTLLNGNFRSEKIIEFQPIGIDQINIVWEWRFVDHLIQDFDSNAPNFGDVASHPELVDFNYEDYNMNHSDWLHMNSIDYNADLDHIILSAKSMGEIYIIDHSTTTTEAAGHTGGNSGKGGDFLWRWGNPEVYRQGTPSDRKLFEQHDAKWVTNGYLNEGKISVFNNDQGGTQTHSSIHLLTPELNSNNEYQITNNTFLPSDYFWSWSGDILGETVLELKKSGVQSLPNGNMILCETSLGRLTEIDVNGNIVWIYRNPSGTVVFNQFATNLEIVSNNSLFRGEKYPKNHPAFDGKDLTPGSIIEDVNDNSTTCFENLSINSHTISNKIRIKNPVLNNILQFNSVLNNASVSIYNISGQQIFNSSNLNGNQIEVSNLKTGLYFVKIENDNAFNQDIFKIIVQ
ncbi:aryl-sulfate sulfotransferase [Formosa maritima]|uniref:T9SS type A sorting domain-containing protein n=1 Tax=Formosa maritima TaxID=2592046 RepID=A0A5D0G7E8_9FLAO|nr:aryl-sulfate sulfotransferase [Formosa maritima]TYA54754.1 T9SS type A sorting domain-containing protein [Formosa maritima]